MRVNAMRKRWLISLAVAACLAMLSPLVAGSIDVVDLDAPGSLAWWFVLVPMHVDVLLGAEQQLRGWVWMAVYFFEYVVLIAAAVGIVCRFRSKRPDPVTHGKAFDSAVSQYHLQDH